MEVPLFISCFIDLSYPQVGVAMVRILVLGAHGSKKLVIHCF